MHGTTTAKSDLRAAGKLKLASSKEEPLKREAPHNLQAEQALLGAILIDNSALERVSGFLEAEHLHDVLHQQIYETAAELITAGKQATPITLQTFFENSKPISAAETVPLYLGRLAANASTTINAREYGRTIHDLATRRQLILMGEEMANIAFDSPVEADPTTQIREAYSALDALRPCDEPIKPTWEAPNESLIDDHRGALPEFPLETLGPAWRRWLIDAARGAGVTPAHVIVPLLAVVSSLIGAARWIRASRSWSEPLTLWTALIGHSGTGKTPGLNVSRRALALIERNRRGSVDKQKKVHEERAVAAKAALKKWHTDVASATEAGRAPPPKPADAADVGAFVTPRFYVSDATIKRLPVLLKARPRGLLLVQDELAGLFINMGRYTNGSDREFWLEAYNGGNYVVERLGRPAVTLDHLLIGITGGFQPDKLVRSFSGDDDGMYARLLFAWPTEPSYEPLSNAVTEVEPSFQEALMRLIDLPAGDDGTFEPRQVAPTSDAGETFEGFRRILHDARPALDGREREWWAKGATQVLRLAGTLAFMDWAMGGGQTSKSLRAMDQLNAMVRGTPEPTEITDTYVKNAVTLFETYFWPHARAALRQGGVSERHKDARAALRWIRARGVVEVSRENLRREALSQRLDADQIDRLIEFLVAAGWLRQRGEGGRRTGRPARRWEVNPRLFASTVAGIAGTGE